MLHRVLPSQGAVLNALDRRLLSLLVPTCLLAAPTAAHADDTYLDSIQLEADKLEGSPGAGEEPNRLGSTDKSDDALAEFERELESRYKGTYLFYKKLPGKSRREVFKEHQQGASIEEARETIMNRFLHTR
jgi:hypothetical protein